MDCDGDGLLNSEEGYIDTDGDGLVNFLDDDDDGDGLATALENTDPNSDGLADDAFDSDNDATPDYLDSNSYKESTIVASDIEVYNALSPNGDGLNDVLTIRNIERYPDNELTVFNRWGKIIYRTKAYGQYNRFFKGRAENGETLPVGTYYYILSIEDGGRTKTFKGSIYINR